MTAAPIIAGYDDALAQTPPPTEARESLPFRFLFGERANLAILLVLFVLTLGLICTLAAMAHIYGRTDPAARFELLKTVGIAASALGIMAVLIRQQAYSESARRSREEIKTHLDDTQQKVYQLVERADGGLDKTVRTVADEVRTAERDLLDLPKTRAEWQEFLRDELRTAARQICEEMKGNV